MNLKHLTGRQLRVDARSIASRERSTAVLLLHYIREVDQRRLFSDWKFSSLFEWLTKELGLCEGSAQLRITAARLLPEVEARLKDGRLTLTNISLVNRFAKAHKEDMRVLLNKVEGQSKKEAEKTLFKLTGKEVPAIEGKERISKTKQKVTYILSDETIEALEEVAALIGGRISKDELLKLAADALKERVEREKFKQTSARASKGTKVTGRIISNDVKRQVYARDKVCTNCGSIHDLNYDHIQPHALGGDNTLENIRLLCFQCNQRAWMTASG